MHIANERRWSEKTIDCMILTTWDFGKGKTGKTVKELIGARG